MAFQGITLTALNNYMKNMETGKIMLNSIPDVGLYQALKDRVDTQNLYGSNGEILIQTSQPQVGKAHGEDLDIPYPGTLAFVKQLVPLREVIDNAGLTKQALDRATGGNASWGNAVELAIKNMMTSFKYTLKLGAMGNGTGALARIVSSSEAGSTGVYTLTVDNTYDDFGIENVALLRPGMRVDIYTGASLNSTAGITVGAVTFGDRKNGAATTGTVVVTDVTGKTFADNDIIYLAGSKDIMPMGLMGIVQDGVTYDGGTAVTTFQGLTRATYSSLQAAQWEATDFGLSSESPADGTPTLWDLSVISDAIQAVKDGGGKGDVDVLLCSAKLAMAIQRRNQAENFMGVAPTSVGGLYQNTAGSRWASGFIAPDGRIIPIVVDPTIPANVLYGLTTSDLVFFGKGDFDYLREYGDIWEPSRGDRKTNYEAPYGGYITIGAERCDNCFVLQDLRTDI